MSIRLYNTLGRKMVDLEPIHKGEVRMYSCGPTVYSRASIGNMRALIFADLLRRMLLVSGLKVTHIMNITDVGHLTDDASEGEDKMELAANKAGETAWDVAKCYTDHYLADMSALNVLPFDVMPKATDHIAEQIAMVKMMEEKGYTYRISDGIYFDTSKLPSYGELSGQKSEEKEEGARVGVNEEKRSPSDFALWKFSPAGTKRHMEWESPWGVGFPGWHIECSAMAEKYLGVPFDIHTGGVDHIAVHHENEIAQTKAARDVEEAKIWMHNEFLLVDGGKMSKSLGNVYSLDDLREKGVSSLGYRYYTLTATYRTPMNFTFDSVLAAQTAYYNLIDAVRELPAGAGNVDERAMGEFIGALQDDLNTPQALAAMWGVVKDADMDGAVKAETLKAMDVALGLKLVDYIGVPVVVPAEVQAIAAERKAARDNKDWAKSDALRDAIAAQGFIVEDGPEGQKIREKR